MSNKWRKTAKNWERVNKQSGGCMIAMASVALGLISLAAAAFAVVTNKRR